MRFRNNGPSCGSRAGHEPPGTAVARSRTSGNRAFSAAVCPSPTSTPDRQMVGSGAPGRVGWRGARLPRFLNAVHCLSTGNVASNFNTQSRRFPKPTNGWLQRAPDSTRSVERPTAILRRFQRGLTLSADCGDINLCARSTSQQAATSLCGIAVLTAFHLRNGL
jgi:hypothetical protein